MFLGTLLAVLLLLPLALQLQTEANRRVVMQLDRTNVTFCDFDDCGILDQFQNLEPIGPAKLTEGEFGTEVLIDVINHDRLDGKREVWAILRTEKGTIIEGMKIWLELKNAGRNQLRFFFTGTKAEFEKANLQLGF